MAINPYNTQSSYYLARSCLEAKQYDKALLQARNSLLLNPFDLEARVIYQRLK
jgi:hypothetical protein